MLTTSYVIFLKKTLEMSMTKLWSFSCDRGQAQIASCGDALQAGKPLLVLRR